METLRSQVENTLRDCVLYTTKQYRIGAVVISETFLQTNATPAVMSNAHCLGVGVHDYFWQQFVRMDSCLGFAHPQCNSIRIESNMCLEVFLDTDSFRKSYFACISPFKNSKRTLTYARLIHEIEVCSHHVTRSKRVECSRGRYSMQTPVISTLPRIALSPQPWLQTASGILRW